MTLTIRPIENWADYLNYRSLAPPKKYSQPNPIDFLIANIAKKTPTTAKAKRAVLKTIYDNLKVKGGQAPIDEADDKYVHATFQRVFSGDNEKPNYTRMKNQLRQLKKQDSPVQKQIDIYRKNLIYQMENMPMEQITLNDLITTHVIWGHQLPTNERWKLEETIDKKIKSCPENKMKELKRTFSYPILIQYTGIPEDI